jgi:molybdopterin synthase catalytic subunit
MITSAFCPPQAEVELSHVTSSPLDLVGLLQKAHHPKAGGLVLFSGEVRNHHENRSVKYLEYEAYVSMANKVIREIVTEAWIQWGLHFAACVHRTGKLEICESAVVVVTAHAHRREAYEANKYIIDRVKHEAPIWKNEFYEDGTSKWGGNCHCGHEH